MKSQRPSSTQTQHRSFHKLNDRSFFHSYKPSLRYRIPDFTQKSILYGEQSTAQQRIQTIEDNMRLMPGASLKFSTYYHDGFPNTIDQKESLNVSLSSRMKNSLVRIRNSLNQKLPQQLLDKYQIDPRSQQTQFGRQMYQTFCSNNKTTQLFSKLISQQRKSSICDTQLSIGRNQHNSDNQSFQQINTESQLYESTVITQSTKNHPSIRQSLCLGSSIPNSRKQTLHQLTTQPDEDSSFSKQYNQQQCLKEKIDIQSEEQSQNESQNCLKAYGEQKQLDNENNTSSTNIFNDNKCSLYDKVRRQKTQSARERRRQTIVDIRNINSFITTMSEFTKQNMPAWLKQREDFARVYQLNELQRLLEIPRGLMKKPLGEKDFSLTSQMMDWIDKNHIFPFNDDMLLKQLIVHMQVMILWEGECLIEEKQLVDYMFIIYKGQIQRLDKRAQDKNILLENKLYFLEACNMQPQNSKYCYVTSRESIVIYITNASFQKILEDRKKSMQQDIMSNLNVVSFFQQFGKDILQRLCQESKLIHIIKDQEVYHKNQKANAFYLLIEGEVLQEDYQICTKSNYWPRKNRQNDQWHYREKRKIRSILKQNIVLKKMDFFGYYELWNNLNYEFTIRATTNCWLLKLSREQFFSIFPKNIHKLKFKIFKENNENQTIQQWKIENENLIRKQYNQQVVKRIVQSIDPKIIVDTREPTQKQKLLRSYVNYVKGINFYEKNQEDIKEKNEQFQTL